MSTTIVKMTAENVKRLQAVSITPSGSTVVIGGNNGEGKCSVIIEDGIVKESEVAK